MSRFTMARRKIIAGNWKMNKTGAEAAVLASDFLKQIGSFNGCDMVLCPPFTALAAVKGALGGMAHVALGAQNLHQEKSGAFTGEISAAMLVDAGCRFVIVGHSERRQYFGETDALVNQKVKAAQAANLIPILCVGETLDVRDAGGTEKLVRTQVAGGLAGLSAGDTARLVLAYEPVWAIGTGRVATPAQAQEVHAWIRSELSNLFGGGAASCIRIQYGGSVKADNAKELLSQPDVDGALVGGASLEAAGFAAICKAAV